MTDIALIIGNKAYSSWSLRPWLAVKQCAVPFQEIVIPLRLNDTKATILKYSSAGKVPVLRHGNVTVWDSLAICEYLNELFPVAQLWPEAAATRAWARAVAAEMHSGFATLRQNLFMDLKRRHDGTERRVAAAEDIDRIKQIWRTCREAHQADGPFLFGQFSIADCMFAPVCTRFQTWDVPLDGIAADYKETILALPAIQDWTAAALAEPWEIFTDIP